VVASASSTKNAIWNNVLYDAPFREANGVFNVTPNACNGTGLPQTISVAGGGTITPNSIFTHNLIVEGGGWGEAISPLKTRQRLASVPFSMVRARTTVE
jgi:hypothetical protein